LVSELSITECTPELLALAGNGEKQEPYREIMKRLRSQLMSTQAYLAGQLKGERVLKPRDLLVNNDQLWAPLYACYRSLQASGMSIIANGQLLDT
ncbi:MAG: phosphoenolpyruvate carboxylase, partial [Serratia symbiotica]|nr:phosphoenolpyruvate carboxylase [Serratia symbiotica]